MTGSPPASPGTSIPPRPLSAMVRAAPRSHSRMSMSSKIGGGSRASDEDGRTAVKVAVRVRPPLQPTDPGYELIPQRFQRSMVQVQSDTSLAIDAPQGRKLFVFDRVFAPDVTQEGIWEYLSECVNAFTQGYNVSLLAYGQSGAGKSYTMGTSGPLEQDDLEAMGVIPRAAIALFEKLEGPKRNPNRSSMSQLRTPARYSQQAPAGPKGEKGWSLRATYVEIYNEQLRDLLIPEHIPSHERGTVTIREDVKGNIILTGLRQVEINSVEDLLGVLNQGSTLRQTDATAINARSSRSHAVFSLNLIQRKSKLQAATGNERRMSMPVEGMTGAEAWVTTDSKLHFVDLAGSERLKNTGAQGERAKEGISINAGLAALGKVISQLSSRQAGSHVSYRDSKLTRLLQDSLGGNAITYMVACVTPAEFHLSETLNTVQYAQRARAIQSKPRIQQVEEGDKQAIIDRLKAEVAFLREQIRSTERSGGERRTVAGSERPERQNEREVELQNQLLDIQENYNNLSGRHAKLIAEMARARDTEASQQLEESLGDSATERLNRSNSFAQAVEQVVLEYEKTIQSLEQSLSSTRATLASTEGSLLEKETRCVYAETIKTQLEARLQKLMDREQSTENYLHDLESKLDGHTSGEEKNTTIIVELRKEIARVRENEAACEDYISTLEERLAEADQDAELMQREIDRLEQVVERQRSLGKLDSLLYELDHIQQEGKTPEPEPEATTNGSNGSNGNGNGNSNGTGHRRVTSRSFTDHSRSQSHVSRGSHLDEAIPESHEEDAIPEEESVQPTKTPAEEEKEEDNNKASEPVTPEDTAETAAADGEPVAAEYPASPAQNKFIADKLDSVSQELVDLRVEHETTLGEFEMLHAKYEEALRTLAELQDAVDEARHPGRQRDSVLSTASATRPPSYFSDTKSSETKDGTRFSGSRSLSSELSSAMESPATMETSDAETAIPNAADSHHHDDFATAADDVASDEHFASELGRLKSMAAVKEAAEKELAVRYEQLQEKHQETLDLVEELKTEVAKAQAANSEASSPRGNAPVIRRKSSQNVMIIDRAHRSFASLRNIAAENFEHNPDVMQNFELNLNAAMHELHARSERIQELEADVATAKKEMETKMTIISGLTRERSSLKASQMDMSTISNLRQQLEMNEKRLQQMQDEHAARETELEQQLEELHEAMEQMVAAAAEKREAEAEAEEKERKKEEEAVAAAAAGVSAEELEAQARTISDLEAELATWEGKHQAALENMQSSEEQLRNTIEELESQVAAHNEQLAENERALMEGEELKEADIKQQNLVKFLRSEIDEYKAIINSNAAKVAEVEASHVATKALLDAAIRDRDAAVSEAEANRQLVASLENQIVEHEQAVRQHHESLRELQVDHAREIGEIKSTSKQDYESQLATLKSQHAQSIKSIGNDLTDAREDLMKVATQVAFALGLDVSVDRISERIDDLIADQKALSMEQKKRVELEHHVIELSNINDSVMRDLESIKASLTEVLEADGEILRSPYPSVTEQMATVKKRMLELETRNKKSSRLVEELEDQLQTNFDQAQTINNRLSTLQTERNAQMEEINDARIKLQSELDTIKEEYNALQAKYDSMAANNSSSPQRSNSQQQQARSSGSVGSLPSPPPAIPLPPLPSGGSSSNNPPTSPTAGRPASKDIALSQIQQDQEARIFTITKHLDAEKQLTATLEEALTDLEHQQKKVKADCEAWRRRAADLEAEIKELKDKPQDNRWSLQQVEEERRKRRDAEIARAHLEERMNTISKKKKKGSLNCF